jgi:hypothetical protein
VVESQPSKLLVAGSIPVSRSRIGWWLVVGGSWSSVIATDSQALRRIPNYYPRPTNHQLVRADVAQLAERVLGKDEVTSSILVIGSSLRSLHGISMASYG